MLKTSFLPPLPEADLSNIRQHHNALSLPSSRNHCGPIKRTRALRHDSITNRARAEIQTCINPFPTSRRREQIHRTVPNAQRPLALLHTTGRTQNQAPPLGASSSSRCRRATPGRRPQLKSHVHGGHPSAPAAHASVNIFANGAIPKRVFVDESYLQGR